MKQLPRFHTPRLIFGLIILLVMAGLPPLVAGQSPAGTEPRATTTLTPNPIYLPLLQALPPGQLLINPSFEDEPDNISPWQWLAPDIDHQLIDDPEKAAAGQHYLAANRQNNTTGNKSFYQEINHPQAGTTYHFAVWVRASEEAAGAGKPRNGRVALWAYGGSAPREHSTRNFQVKGTQWHCVETALQVSQPGQPYLRAEVYLTSLDSYPTYFDDAILRIDGQTTCPPAPVVDGGTVVTQGQGFDICAAPGVSQLAAWKQHSPYEYLGIYLGGVSHYAPCKAYNQQHQTPAWFSAVSQQGWRFIPIWIGPQAPCTGYTVRFSGDTTIARSQGRAEAQQALQAAYTLGLLNGARQKTIIYYDMEYYSPADTACHNAANAFLEGWVSELQDAGQSAGIYGAAWAVNSWYLLKHVPDSVWIPWYISPTGYDPAMSVSVANQEWVTESYWANHRLFQYSGSHTEAWGGVSLNIDNDTASGIVALGEGARAAPLQAVRLITPDQGWIIFDHSLFWSGSGGDHWTNITPSTAPKVHQAFFLDTSYGWALSRAEPDSPFYLSATGDGGQSWQTQAVELEPEQPVSEVQLHFVDRQTGWLALKWATGLNFSAGQLFKTKDGGLTWTPLSLPGGGPVYFVDDMTGWTVGGPTLGELYFTQDGGQSWQAQRLVSTSQGYAAYTLPVFTNSQEGVIAAAVTTQNRSWVELLTTHNGGQSWQPAGSIALKQSLALGVVPPLDLLDVQSWLVAGSQQTPPFPEGLIALEFATRQVGWAQAHGQLWRTRDGGQRWTLLPLPAP